MLGEKVGDIWRFLAVALRALAKTDAKILPEKGLVPTRGPLLAALPLTPLCWRLEILILEET